MASVRTRLPKRFHARLGTIRVLLFIVALVLLASQSWAGALAAPHTDGLPQMVSPAITLQPESGGAGTIVTVTGDDFPGSSLIYILLAGSNRSGGQTSGPMVYATTLSDFEGNIWASFTMPATWPNGSPIHSGTLTVVATTLNFVVQAGAPFDFVAAQPTPAPQNPSAQATPSSGGPGTQVAVEGGGFTPDAQLFVTLGKFDGQIQTEHMTIYATAFADDGGNYRMRFEMPALWPDGAPMARGPVLVMVQEFASDRLATDTFNYTGPPPTPTPTPRPARNPWAEVRPSAGGASTLVTLSGGGFPPRVRLNAHLAGTTRTAGSGAPASYASTVTDGNGVYSMQFPMPATWPSGTPIRSGTIAIVAATEDLGTTATAQFDYREGHTTASTWHGAYYANESLSGPAMLERTDPAIDFDWGRGSPAPGLPADHFSVGWTSLQRFQPGRYRFTAEVDDGMKLYVGNQLVLFDWRVGARRIVQAEVHLRGGDYPLRMEYFERGGDAVAKLRWTLVRPDPGTPEPTATPASPYKLLFDDDPRNNRRKVNNYFCSGFESECEYGSCRRDYRVVWALYCRETDYPYIEPGEYRVTLYGAGNVRAGATDYGAYRTLYAFGEHRMSLPGSYTFCWPGLQDGGTGFETIVQSNGTSSRIDRIRIEYLGACAR